VILANATSAARRDAPGYRDGMTVLRSVVLFALAALAEIGGAWLVWQGVREHRGLVFVGAGILALGLYGFAATFQPDPHFGRILAAYGGVFGWSRCRLPCHPILCGMAGMKPAAGS
jgi:Uncharacterised BCR, YnfA/UPF0060 family